MLHRWKVAWAFPTKAIVTSRIFRSRAAVVVMASSAAGVIVRRTSPSVNRSAVGAIPGWGEDSGRLARVVHGRLVARSRQDLREPDRSPGEETGQLMDDRRGAIVA